MIQVVREECDGAGIDIQKLRLCRICGRTSDVFTRGHANCERRVCGGREQLVEFRGGAGAAYGGREGPGDGDDPGLCVGTGAAADEGATLHVVHQPVARESARGAVHEPHRRRLPRPLPPVPLLDQLLHHRLVQ